MEIELKLALDAAAADALRHHPLLAHYAARAPRTATLENHYFDTPSLDLYRQGIELRLRRIGKRYRQTLKAVPAGTRSTATPATAGLREREEWELPLRAGRLDVPALLQSLPAGADAIGRQLAAFAAGPDFAARVVTHYRRTTWMLTSARGDRVELALDVGNVQALGLDEAQLAHGRVALCEVELELLAGERRALFELASTLQATLPLRIETRGKAERGFVLLLPAVAAPARLAKQVPLEGDMGCAQALRAIVGECLAQVQDNEAGLAQTQAQSQQSQTQTEDTEYVHQMRVGLRRLRSAIDLFRAFAALPQALQDDLRWAADQLGATRDAEVLVEDTLARVPAPAHLDWAALLNAATAAAVQTRHEAVAALGTPRHGAWPLALMTWVEDLAARPAGPDDETLQAYARRELRRLRSRLLKRGRLLEGADAAARHRVRIAAKKLRYAGDMLAHVAGGRRAKERQRALSALQQELGVLNDAEVAAGLLARHAADVPSLAAAAAYAQGWIAADAERRLRRLDKVWQRVRDAF